MDIRKMKPIQVFLRQCYHSPNSNIPNRVRPQGFSKQACLRNLLATTNSNLVDITIIYDNHFGPLNTITYGLPVVEVNCGNEAKSFLETIEVIFRSNLSDDTIVYFLEDDYLHRLNWASVIMEGVQLADYVTLYDHLDKYKDYPDLTSKIMVSKSCHWRTTPSTTNTYACKFSTLKRDLETHKQFSRDREISDDNGKFLQLGRDGRSLVSSIPGYSTHCDNYMSPCVKWEF